MFKKAIAIALLPVAGTAFAQNLLENGDFQSGNTGFSSQYEYVHTLTEGSYCITPSPVYCDEAASDFGDHTTGYGEMMVVEASLEPNTIVWSETVPTRLGQTYSFSGWTTSWNNNRHPFGQAVLKMLINHETLGTVTVTNFNGVWHPFSFPWTAKSRHATLSIVDTNTGGFVLDDLGFAAPE